MIRFKVYLSGESEELRTSDTMQQARALQKEWQQRRIGNLARIVPYAAGMEFATQELADGETLLCQ